MNEPINFICSIYQAENYIFKLTCIDFKGKIILQEHQKNRIIPINLKFIETFAPIIILGVIKSNYFTNSVKQLIS